MSSHAASTQSSGHHGELPPGHFHHVEPEQAYHASKLGMWIFLATEVHLFGALFCTFAAFRWKFRPEFDEFARHLDWKLGCINTAVLLTSSFFMVMGVDRAQKGLNKQVFFWLTLTQICACMFLVIKYIEWTTKFAHGITPSTHIFYGLYFTMTGLHGVHVLVGMGLIGWLMRLAKKNRFSVSYYTPVDVVGLYWHLVDVVWIYLFPLFYLLGGIAGVHH